MSNIEVTPEMVRAVAGLIFDTELPASIAHELTGMAEQMEKEADEPRRYCNGRPVFFADDVEEADGEPLKMYKARPDPDGLWTVWSDEGLIEWRYRADELVFLGARTS